MTSSKPHKRYLKTAQLHFVPTTEILAVFEPAAAENRHNQRFDLDLPKGEFIADGQDELAVVLFVHRVGAPQDQVFPGSLIKTVKLGGTAAAEYQLLEDEAFAKDQANLGRKRFTVRTKDGKPLLHNQTRAAATLTLDADAQLPAQRPPNHAPAKPPLTIQAKIPLKPRCIYLAMWVVPGQLRGTSTVGVGSFLCRDKGQWLELKLAENDFEVKAVAPQLTLNLHRTNQLVSTGGTHNFTPVPLPPWLSVWRMRYVDLAWSNVAHAPITVLCRMTAGDEAVAFHIDVRQNLAEMIDDIDANSGKLELTNPDWQSNGIASKCDYLLARRELRGPVYNIHEFIRRKWFDKYHLPHPPDLDKYTCGSMSLRLCNHVVARRNGSLDPHTALRMNGIEACQYVLEGWHDWFGFHLSGSGQGDDPIFIDPWWTQEWRLADVKDDYGFTKQAALIAAVFTLVICESIVILTFLVWLVRAALSQALPAARVILSRGLTTTLSTGSKSLPALIDLPTLMEVKAFFDQSILARIAAFTEIAAVKACLKASNGNPQLFDDDFNYSHFDELHSFSTFANELQQGTPKPLTTTTWPN